MENLGEIFKKAREDKMLTIKDVSVQTNISSKFIKAIESNDFSAFPGEAYIVGFIRNYSDFLKLNSDNLIKIFHSNQMLESETPIEELVAPTKPRLNPIPIILLILFIGGAIAAIFFIVKNRNVDRQTNQQNSQSVESQQQVQQQNIQPVNQNITVTGMPIIEKRFIIGDKVYVLINDKKMCISLTKIDTEYVEVSLSSAEAENFLSAMDRTTFKIGLKKQLKIDLHPLRQETKTYDVSLSLLEIINSAQVKISVEKIDEIYSNNRYYDDFPIPSGEQNQQTQPEQQSQTVAQQTPSRENQQQAQQTQTAARQQQSQRESQTQQTQQTQNQATARQQQAQQTQSTARQQQSQRESQAQTQQAQQTQNQATARQQQAQQTQPIARQQQQTQQTQTVARQQPQQPVKLNLILTNHSSADGNVFVWVQKDNSAEMQYIPLARNQSIAITAGKIITVQTNNLFGLRVSLNGQGIATRSIANDGGVGKLRCWIDKNPSGRTEIKWEINR